jgi:hypothetical protein
MLERPRPVGEVEKAQEGQDRHHHDDRHQAVLLVAEHHVSSPRIAVNRCPFSFPPHVAGTRSGIRTPGYEMGLMRGRAALNQVNGALGALVIGVVAGCAPQSPDHSSWRDQAYQALDEVSSNVATASLLLRQLGDDRVFGKYAQIVALNAETNAGQVTSKFSAEQPVPADSIAYHHVTTTLSDAGDVLSRVRIAIVRRDEGAYPRLLHQLSVAGRQLSRTEHRIGGRTG